eukprot:TRINITY_DN1863_c0_g1_i4.p2 TRINITY_DN1863_c0_g1~~TRINITY_DN1863_c0_g1_i4.p2  ORF type:complete len:139 (-),score=37.47 TRINITY_DN1863_c0_g1_i4:85-501(-)
MEQSDSLLNQPKVQQPPAPAMVASSPLPPPAPVMQPPPPAPVMQPPPSSAPSAEDSHQRRLIEEAQAQFREAEARLLNLSNEKHFAEDQLKKVQEEIKRLNDSNPVSSKENSMRFSMTQLMIVALIFLVLGAIFGGAY